MLSQELEAMPSRALECEREAGSCGLECFEETNNKRHSCGMILFEHHFEMRCLSLDQLTLVLPSVFPSSL